MRFGHAFSVVIRTNRTAELAKISVVDLVQREAMPV